MKEWKRWQHLVSVDINTLFKECLHVTGRPFHYRKLRRFVRREGPEWGKRTTARKRLIQSARRALPSSHLGHLCDAGRLLNVCKIGEKDDD